MSISPTPAGDLDRVSPNLVSASKYEVKMSRSHQSHPQPRAPISAINRAQPATRTPEHARESRTDTASSTGHPATTRSEKTASERAKGRGGSVGYPVPLSMTMAGRAVASMAGSSVRVPAGSCLRRRRWRGPGAGHRVPRRDRGLASPRVPRSNRGGGRWCAG